MKQLIFFLLLSTGISAQGEYFEKETNGLGGFLGIAKNSESNWLGLGAGYSLNGVFDIGATVGRQGSDISNLHLSSVAIRPEIAVHPIKQSGDMPINLDAFIGYQFDVYKIDELDDLNVGYIITSNTPSLALWLSHNFEIDDKATFQPNINMRYFHSSVEFDFDDIYCRQTGICDFTDKSENLYFGLGGSLLFGSGRQIFVINPDLAFSEDVVRFSIRLGLLFRD